MAKGTSRRSLAGGAVLALLGGTTALAAPAVATNDDAELIRICAEVGVHRYRFNHESVLDSDECPVWANYIRCADAISDAEPQTLAGLVAKAQAAKLEATNPAGEEDPAGTVAARWAWDLVNDLARLGRGA